MHLKMSSVMCRPFRSHIENTLMLNDGYRKYEYRCVYIKRNYCAFVIVTNDNQHPTLYIYIGSVWKSHYGDVVMGAIATQITSLTVVYSTVYSDADQGKHQSSASLAFVWGIHRGPVNSPHKWPVTRKMFPFDDVIMLVCSLPFANHNQRYPFQKFQKALFTILHNRSVISSYVFIKPVSLNVLRPGDACHVFRLLGAKPLIDLVMSKCKLEFCQGWGLLKLRSLISP